MDKAVQFFMDTFSPLHPKNCSLAANETKPERIRGVTLVTRRASYNLLMTSRDRVKRFHDLDGFSIHRKMEKLEDALRILKTKDRKKRPDAWKERYYKQNGEWTRR